MKRSLCLFDLDLTLLPIDSDHAWGQFMVSLGWADGESYLRANDAYYAQYQAGTLDIHDYVEFSTRAFRDRPAAEQAAAHARFMAEVIGPRVLPAALDLVQAHLRRGDLVAIITATNEFVTRPIAAALGAPHILAIDLERDTSGTITGRIHGVPTFREGKVARTEQWLADQGSSFGDFERISVYSDSMNDLPLLERATDPVATNPSPALEALAVERGWRVLRLFHDQEIH